MYVTVIGCGSIGSRHLRNLRALGVMQLTAVDPDTEQLAKLAEEIPGLVTTTDFEEALASGPDAVVVAAPTWLHTPLTRQAIAAGAHVLIEKPLAHDREGLAEMLDEARRTKRILMTAYSMRFHPGLRLVHGLLEEGRIGRALAVRAMCGQYLPDWHPWQDYREFYMSKEAQGGGAVLDISHEIDTLRRFFGEVRDVSAFVGKVGNLEMDADDLSILTLRFDSGPVASIHLDLLSRAYRRDLEIIGEHGTIRWDYTEQAVHVYTAATKTWEAIPFEFERNRLYVDEMATFLAACRGEGPVPVTGADSHRTLEVVLAAKAASRTGRRTRVRRSIRRRRAAGRAA